MPAAPAGQPLKVLPHWGRAVFALPKVAPNPDHAAR